MPIRVGEIHLQYTTLSGICRFNRRGDPPDDRALEVHVDDMYEKLGKEGHERVRKAEALEYYGPRLVELCEPHGLLECPTHLIFLLCYGCIPASLAVQQEKVTVEELGFDDVKT